MRHVILSRLLMGTCMLLLVTALPSCKKETEVKPKEVKTTAVDAPPTLMGEEVTLVAENTENMSYTQKKQ